MGNMWPVSSQKVACETSIVDIKYFDNFKMHWLSNAKIITRLNLQFAVECFLSIELIFHRRNPDENHL